MTQRCRRRVNVKCRLALKRKPSKPLIDDLHVRGSISVVLIAQFAPVAGARQGDFVAKALRGTTRSWRDVIRFSQGYRAAQMADPGNAEYLSKRPCLALMPASIDLCQRASDGLCQS